MYLLYYYKKQIAITKEHLLELKQEVKNSEASIRDNYNLASSIETDIIALRKEQECLATSIEISSQEMLALKNKQNYLHNDLVAIENLQKTQREQLQANLIELENSERNKLKLILEQV